MLLTCPACSTRYTVSASVVPAEGRVVRCSACRAEWLARPTAGIQPQPAVAAATPEPAAPPMPAAQAAPAPSVPATPPAAPASLPPEPSVAAPADAAQPGATPPPPLAAATPGNEAPQLAAAGTDPEAASPQVTAARAPRSSAQVLAETLEDETSQRAGTGFLAGFAVVTALVLLALTVYIKHAALAEAVPALAAPLDDYVALVDRGRLEIARMIADLRG